MSEECCCLAWRVGPLSRGRLRSVSLATAITDFVQLLEYEAPRSDQHAHSEPAIAELASLLYYELHARARPPHEEQFVAYRQATSQLTAQLFPLGRHLRRREHDWTLVAESDGRCRIARGGLTLWVSQTDVSTAGTGVVVELPSERRNLSPGYYVILGPEPARPEPHDCRLYFHVAPRQAPSLARRLLEELRASGIPFTFKVLSDAALYGRTDAAVMYFEQSDRFAAIRLAREVVAEGGIVLQDPVSHLALPVAPGVGYAETKRSASFGMERCTVLARGIVDRLVDAPESAAESALEALSAEGLDPERPHLEPASFGDSVGEIVASAWHS